MAADDDSFAHDLREALTLASATAVLGAPAGHRDLVELVLASAADVAGTSAAALFIVDADERNLVFQALVQDGTPRELDEFGLPLDDAATASERFGIASADALSVPLSIRDREIGLLLFFDTAAGQPIRADMDAVVRFAKLAAVTIEQSRTQHRVMALVVQLVEGIGAFPEYDVHGLTERTGAFTAELGEQAGYLAALDMARLVREIVGHGDAATQACRGVLNDYVDYLRVASTFGTDEGSTPWER